MFEDFLRPFVDAIAAVLRQLICFFFALRRLFSRRKAKLAVEWSGTDPCGFGKYVRYDVSEPTDRMDVTVRIKLVPYITPAGIGPTDDEIENIKPSWKSAIESVWSNRIPLMRGGNVNCDICPDPRCDVFFTVQWVESNQHHTVNVAHPNTVSANRIYWELPFPWDTGQNAQMAAHEFGHMIGLIDEYPYCPERPIFEESSVMYDGTVVRARHMEPFATWLSNRTGCTYIAQEQ